MTSAFFETSASTYSTGAKPTIAQKLNYPFHYYDRRRGGRLTMPALPLSLSDETGMTLAASSVPSEMLLLKQPRKGGSEVGRTRGAALLPPSLFEGPQFSCQLVNMQQLRRRRGHPTPPTEPRLLQPHGHGHPRRKQRQQQHCLVGRIPLPPNAVNSSGFQMRIDSSEMAARRYHDIMNALKSVLLSLPFRHTSRFVLPKLR